MNQLKTLWAPGVCILFIVLGLIVSQDIAWLFYLIAICIGGYEQTRTGLEDTLKHKRLNIELLMILSAIGACILGDFKEGAILIFIFSLAGGLETLTLDRSNRDIRALMEKQPQTASRLSEDGTYEIVSVDAIGLNDTIRVASGEMIAVDGVILEGESTFEESSITGESVPVEKGVGQTVYGGTLNMTNPIVVTVDKDPEDMVLKRIVRMVESSKLHQSKASSFIDAIEGYYAAGVVIAVALVILGEWLLLNQSLDQAFYTGIVLLVVASPCALVASVTPATLAAISNGSRHGLLVKGGAYFEALANIRALAFDKTGTLTQGKPMVEKAVFEDQSSEHWGIFKALEEQSSHPLAHAIIQYLSAVDPYKMTDVQEIKGQGIRGTYHGVVYKLGSESFVGRLPDKISAFAQQSNHDGYTLVYASENERCIGFFAISDPIREEASELVQWLKENQIEPIMITGDRSQVAHTIGSQLGIRTVIAESLPDQKANHIQELLGTYGSVGMIGDGINDAPALANASVGIAMSNGTDIAIESSDIVLTTPNILNVAYAIKLAKRLKNISRQNIVFSLSVIVCLIVFNFTRSLPLPAGVVFHEGSTILVIMNGLRMLRPIK